MGTDSILISDMNGNLTGAYRQGMVNDDVSDPYHTYDTMDDYVVEYNGNQKRSVNGTGAGNPSYFGSSSFVDGMPEGDNEYAYNANGAMTKDMNKGINDITYDLLGNLREITMSDNRSIRYVYVADGTRLRTTHKRKVGNTYLRDSTEYLGNLIVKNGQPVMYRFSGGYFAFDNGALSDCHYYIQDYLGSNRMVVSKGGSVKQSNHYYPYGGIIGGIDFNPTLQPYKFEDKELDRTYGLDWYDIHARQYDPVVPSWHTIDPLAEKYYSVSPYAYCLNNPVKFIDRTGLKPGDFFKKMDDAAIDFGNYINKKSIQENREYITSFYIIMNDNGETGYTYFEPIAGTSNKSGLKIITKNGENFVNGEKVQATGHTHGAYNENFNMGNDVFSGILKDGKIIEGNDERKKVTDKTNDIGSSNVLGIPDYLVTPNGSLQQYNPSEGSVRLVSKDMPKDEKDPNKIKDVMNMYK